MYSTEYSNDRQTDLVNVKIAMSKEYRQLLYETLSDVRTNAFPSSARLSYKSTFVRILVEIKRINSAQFVFQKHSGKQGQRHLSYSTMLFCNF